MREIAPVPVCLPLVRPAADEYAPPEDAAPAAPSMAENGDVFVFPATAAQRRLWLLDQLVPAGNPALNMPIAVRLTGPLDAGALESSFQEILRRHEVLRTTFQCTKGQLWQIIAPQQALAVPQVDAGDFPAAERPLIPARLMADEARQPFDLARGPVIRVRLVRITAEEHLLLVTIHHIVSDGWSNGVLLRELGELYTAAVHGLPSPLPPLPIQFADFAQWQQDQAAGGGPDDGLAFWREALAGELPVLDLPTDRPRRPARGRAAAGDERRIVLPPSLAAALKALAAREGASAFMLYLAAFVVLLSRYGGGQEDILVNTPSANRHRREVEPLIGPFVNPLLLRVDLAGDPTFRALLGRVRRVVLGAFEHAEVPFEKVLEELQPRRLQVDFLYQNNFLQPARLPQLDLVPLAATRSAVLGEWAGAVVEDRAQTVASIAYNADLFDAATVDRALAGYQSLLEAIAAPDGPETAISRLSSGELAAGGGGGGLVADRWRLPAGSIRWMDRCFEPAAAGREDASGCPRPGAEVRVLDRHLQPTPVGVAGEIYVSAPPAADPDSAAPAGGRHPRHGPLLATGDLARRRADGRMQWLGRVDEQVRVQGLRVDLSETEAALETHPHVTRAVVLWNERSDGGPRSTAFFLSDGAPPALVSHQELRDFLREILPEELIPLGFVPMKHFPLTTDGRLDPAVLWEHAARLAPPETERYGSPHLTIHYQLIEIWRELLAVRSIGIRDDFFALGGNSLLAMQMLYRVEQACGKPLLPATLFQQATIEHLASEILRQDEGEPAPEVIKICGTGTKTPMFFLHGDLTGGGFYCMKLSRRLGPDQPFYALPPLDVSGYAALPEIEHIAAAQLKTIRAVQPHGPYVLGGFCLGGLTAFEIARQLEAQGETVERLLIIDATVRNRRLKTLRRWVERIGRWRGFDQQRQIAVFSRWHFLVARLKRWRQMDWPEQWEVVCRRVQNRWQRLVWRFWPPVAQGSGAAAAGDWFDPRWDVPLAFLWATGGYAPPPYGGAATLLLSNDLTHGNGEEDALREWGRLVSALDTHELAGSHLACITEHVGGLAESVRDCLKIG